LNDTKDNVYGDNDSGTKSDEESPHELDIIAEFKKREEKMSIELQQLNNEVSSLKMENQELIKQSNPKTDRSTDVGKNS
jgi:hypothetical protein